MNFLKRLLLSIFSGLLLSFAWPVDGFYPLIFIAWVPLLMLENDLNTSAKTPRTFFGYSFITVLVWNIITTWWIKNASFGGALMAIVANSIIMAFVLYLFHFIKVKKGEKIGYMALIAFWMTFEYIHLRWDITWPWLHLGNVFANQIEIIQWYEFTGVFGGTLWVLLVNVLCFKIIKYKIAQLPVKSLCLKVLSLLIIPILVSLIIYVTYAEKSNPLNVVAVQPNIDPYNEKFSGLSSTQQLEKLLEITNGKLDQETDYLVCPETALVEYIWEDRMHESSDLKKLDSLLKAYPKLNILIGASTLKVFLPGETVSSTARKFGNTQRYFDSYNTALQLDA
jgi:apolipoprotein N-acyltransferase